MRSEAGVGAIEAAQEAIKQNALSQATELTNQAMMAQRFELDLNRATELAAAKFQADEASRRKLNEVQLESFKTGGIPEAEVRPAVRSHTLGNDVVNYMNEFSQKASGLVSDLHQAVDKVEEAPPVQGKVTNSFSSGSEPAFDSASALRFLVRTYEVAIETHLIANAAHESTGIFNSLMKGQ